MKREDIDASYRAWYRRTWPNHILAAPVSRYPEYRLLTIDMITREALRLFRNSNSFIRMTKAPEGFASWDDYYNRLDPNLTCAKPVIS